VEVAVDYTVHVPRRRSGNPLNTVNGSLRVTDLDSVGDLRTVNGNIESSKAVATCMPTLQMAMCISN